MCRDGHGAGLGGRTEEPLPVPSSQGEGAWRESVVRAQRRLDSLDPRVADEGVWDFGELWRVSER